MVLILVLCSGLQARGDVRSSRAWLSWQAPEGCATLVELKEKLSVLVKRPVVWAEAAEQSQFSIQVEVEPLAASWRARITLRDVAARVVGVREVASRFEQCSELDVPLALVIATLVDGLWDKLAVTPPPAEAPAKRRGALGGFVGAVLGLAGEPWGCADVRLELPWLNWPVALDGRLYLPAQDVDALGRGARYGAAQAGLSLCPVLWTGPGPRSSPCVRGRRRGSCGAAGPGSPFSAAGSCRSRSSRSGRPGACPSPIPGLWSVC